LGGYRGVAGILTQGEIRRCDIPTQDKQRPAVVLTRDGSIGHLATVTVAPVTSTIRGVPSDVILDEDGMTGKRLFGSRWAAG
jgi:mRNA interferase MazF